MEQKSNFLSYLVFISTLSIVLISLFAIIFPGFLISNYFPYDADLEPFEPSIWLIPVFSFSFIVLALGFGYYKTKLPDQIYKCIKFVLNFETSKRTTLIIVIIILIFYIGFSVNELSINEDGQWSDYNILKEALEIWPSTESDNIYVEEQNSRYVRMALLVTSLEIFQNIKILPFVASISLLVVTFFITYQISHKRFSGIIAMLILLQSHTFLHFDTVAVYENFWILFFLLGLYLINKKWQLSSALYLLAIFSKAFIFIFFPSVIFYIYRAKISSNKKIWVICSYGAAALIVLVIFSFEDSIYNDIISISDSEFFLALNTLGYTLRYDVFIIVSLLPITVGLFCTSRRGILQADSILILILTSLLAGPFISMLTEFYFVLPYRFLPLIVFVAIGIGVFFSRRT
ncbi:MAG: hypothetical protein VX209_02805 [Thermoproteota archaeon]|nr:hypothetical protein [Thermoproteota archaeon]